MTKSVQQIKNRIASIEKTKKVTSAMQMISLAKLNRIEKRFYALRPYFFKFESLMYNLINARGLTAHPFLQEKTVSENICLCVVTSDSGLCGSYNNVIINKAEDFIRNHTQDKISLVCVGRKGFNYFKKRSAVILNTHLGLNGRYSDEAVQEITNNLIGMFTSGMARQIYIAYTHCQTVFIHTPKIEKFLALRTYPETNRREGGTFARDEARSEDAGVAEKALRQGRTTQGASPEQMTSLPTSGFGIGSKQKVQEPREYLFEPEIKGILEKIIPTYLLLKLKAVILESFVAEHAARAMAMKLSTDNARDLLDSLIMSKNKLRQANITQELLEIISSSEALKG